MSTQDESTVDQKLYRAIDTVLDEMSEVSPDSVEYGKMADQLVKLYKMREIDNNFKLKQQDALGRQSESQNQNGWKEVESENRRKEIENSLRIKELEIALKEREIHLKEDESELVSDLRAVEVELKKKQLDLLHRVSLDTWVVVGANILGIVLILGHERAHVVTSKAIGFVSKLR